MQTATEAEHYLKSCASDFWQRVFEAELKYLQQYLNPKDEILSVGCGPAIIERQLVKQGFKVVGLDVSHEAMVCAGDAVRVVAALAEQMPFDADSFDLVMFIASLQFIDDYQAALQQAATVLKPQGRLIALLLNPDSSFFKARYTSSKSYLHRLRHTDLAAINTAAAKWFQTADEYYLGIDGDRLFDSNNPTTAALYILTGTKKDNQCHDL